LLELKESYTDEFLKLVKSAMGADTTEDRHSGRHGVRDDTASETTRQRRHSGRHGVRDDSGVGNADVNGEFRRRIDSTRTRPPAGRQQW